MCLELEERHCDAKGYYLSHTEVLEIWFASLLLINTIESREGGIQARLSEVHILCKKEMWLSMLQNKHVNAKILILGWKGNALHWTVKHK